MSSGNSYEGDRFADREHYRRTWEVRSIEMADLRAKIEALRSAEPDQHYWHGWDNALDAVLDLIDGGSDE